MIKFVLKFSLLLTLLFSSNAPSSSVVRTGEGFIDYSNRVIVSRGTAAVNQNDKSRNGYKIIEKNLKISKGEAKAKARENMLGLIKIAPSSSCSTDPSFLVAITGHPKEKASRGGKFSGPP